MQYIFLVQPFEDCLHLPWSLSLPALVFLPFAPFSRPFHFSLPLPGTGWGPSEGGSSAGRDGCSNFCLMLQLLTLFFLALLSCCSCIPLPPICSSFIPLLPICSCFMDMGVDEGQKTNLHKCVLEVGKNECFPIVLCRPQGAIFPNMQPKTWTLSDVPVFGAA